MNERPVLFLDVDGVLNTSIFPGSIMSGPLGLVTEIHNIVGCDIVIESMWRESDKQICRLLRHLLTQIPRNYIYLTPLLGELFESYPYKKSAEISQWLIRSRRPGFSNFVILDDELIPGYEEKQILVQPDTGLNRSVLEQTILRLQCQKSIM